MNRYNNENNNDKKEGEGMRADEGQMSATEQSKGAHQGNRDNAKDWKPGSDTGNDENEGGVRPE
jgi:hypothetical protein